MASIRLLRGLALAAVGLAASVSTGALAQDSAARRAADFDDYDQWKQALGADSADAASIAALDGFRVQRLRVAAEGEGSWISIDFDPRGRLVVAREDRGLLRFTLPGDLEQNGGKDIQVETMPLVLKAKTQEERLHYLWVLRTVRHGWTLEQRRTYFQWLLQPGSFSGAQSLPIMLSNIEADARTTLSKQEQTQLAEFFAALPKASPAQIAAAASQRPFVRDWKLEELDDLLGELDRGRNFERGREMASAAQCVNCHRLANAGTAVGPDLAGAGSRFGRRDLLETILSPSKFVDDKYRNEVIELSDGTVVVGRVTGADEQSLLVLAHPLEPGRVTRIAKSEIESRTSSPVSPMPTGLLNTLSKDEILDLLAYLIAEGKPGHPSFQAPRR